MPEKCLFKLAQCTTSQTVCEPNGNFLLLEVEVLRLTLFISIDAQSVTLMHVGEIDMIKKKKRICVR